MRFFVLFCADLFAAALWPPGSHPASAPLLAYFKWVTQYIARKCPQALDRQHAIRNHARRGHVRSEHESKLLDHFRTVLWSPQKPSASAGSVPGPAAERYSALAQRAARQHMRLVDQAGDGNCLFSSLAHQLEHATTMSGQGQVDEHYTAARLRAMVMQQLRKDFDSPEQREQFQVSHPEGIDEYIAQHSREGEYGGYAEIQAFANRFNVNVRIMFGNADSSFIVQSVNRQNEAVAHVSTLTIGYVNFLDNYSKKGGGYNHFLSILLAADQAR